MIELFNMKIKKIILRRILDSNMFKYYAILSISIYYSIQLSRKGLIKN